VGRPNFCSSRRYRIHAQTKKKKVDGRNRPLWMQAFRELASPCRSIVMLYLGFPDADNFCCMCLHQTRHEEKARNGLFGADSDIVVRLGACRCKAICVRFTPYIRVVGGRRHSRSDSRMDCLRAAWTSTRQKSDT
jgi:hypothetical protein